MRYFRTFAYWGIIALLVLTCGLNVRLLTIFNQAVLVNDLSSFVCILLFISIPFYIAEKIDDIKFILETKKLNDGHLWVWIAGQIYANITRWIRLPYCGLCFRGFAKVVKTKYKTFIEKEEIVKYIIRFLATIIFWTMGFFGIKSILATDNLVREAIFLIPQKEAIIRAALSIVIILGVSLAVRRIADKIFNAGLKDIDEKERLQKKQEKRKFFSQRYYGVPIKKLVDIGHECRRSSTVHISEDGKELYYDYRSFHGRQIFHAGYYVSDGKLVSLGGGSNYPGQTHFPDIDFLNKVNKEIRFKKEPT